MGDGDQPSSPGGKPLRGQRLPLEKLADLAPCQDQIDKVKRTKTSEILQSVRRDPAVS
jgi:hypothetical protein